MINDLTSPPPYTDVSSILIILAVQLAVWVPFFAFAPRALKRIMTPTGLIEAYAKREIANMKNLLGIGLSTDEARTVWCEWMCTGVNHFVGGLCALPLFLSAAPTPTHWMLFVAALMGEVAFDMYDLARRWIEQLFYGGTLGGWTVVTLASCHHPASILMAIPMLVFKPDHPDFHSMVFSLIFAGGVTLLGGFGCQVFDIKKRAGLRRMRLATLVVWGVVVWARVFCFFPSAWRLLVLFHAETSSATFAAIAAIAAGMLIFNLFFLGDWTGKLVKVFTLTPTEEKAEGADSPAPEQEVKNTPKSPHGRLDVRARMKRQDSFASAAA